MGIIVLLCLFFSASGVPIPGFSVSPFWGEQIIWLTFGEDVVIHENAPSINSFNPQIPTQIIFYALPDGNTINETVGEQNGTNVDWHYLIQEIGAQTRRLREVGGSDMNLITIYLANTYLSWPAWRNKHGQDEITLIPNILRAALNPFRALHLDYELTLCSHSGGGGFMFGYMDASPAISDMSRLCFLDSDYDFDDSPTYATQLINWLQATPSPSAEPLLPSNRRSQRLQRGTPAPNSLVVIAYDDRNITYNGKPVTCDTCGTYRRTLEMVAAFQAVPVFNLTYSYPGTFPPEDQDIEMWQGYNGLIDIRIHLNPNNTILHTVLVYMNGFIHGVSTTSKQATGDWPVIDDQDIFFGDVQYQQWIQPDS